MSSAMEFADEVESFQSSSRSKDRFRKCGNSSSICFCGNAVVTQTSWTEINPARRFLACENRGDRSCGYFLWVDPPMCERSKVVIPELLRKISELENEISSFHKQKRALWIVILFLVLVHLYSSVLRKNVSSPVLDVIL